VSLPFSASKPTVLPPPFCLASAHAQPLSPQCYCLRPTCDPTYSSQLPASTRNKKKLDKKTGIAMLQMHLWQSCGITPLFCVRCKTGSRNRCQFRSRSYKLLHAMAPDESSIETFESSHSPKLKLFRYSYFRSISPRYDYLLRHPRCCQLLHPSESQPQTKGCPRMRHLWVHRTAHNQTIPSLWWLCTSLICLFVPNANSMSSDVIQMTTNYCVSTSPCCYPASADQTNIKICP
jgi:hypothetical protein